ncbi:MAG: type III secretion system outer membrane ring subunit SctC, partial [Pseudomonadota bacterium]
GGARIEADPRMNAVIVRDTAERMPIYADLIRSLDVAPQLIEIQATIIDVDTDRLREIGIQYRFTDTDDRADVTFGGRVTEGLTLSPEDFVNPFSRGLLASGVVGDENVFSARIAALETEGIARVVSRPQVMTLANVEAVFDNTRTFFVRVAGAVDVDLFNISVGTTLSVTPHILEETGAPHIKLLVNVEDGQLTGGEVDDIPIIERSSVNTQALVGAEESLLIGGLTVESSEAFEDKVPFLGDIPLLGRLFKSRSSRRGRIERLFLITPRLTTAGD